MNNNLTQEINERYRKEIKNESMGCGNLNPFLVLKEGDKLLDLGCGNGNWTKSLYKFVGERGKIVGIDLTDEMIKKAKENNDKSNIFFIKANIETLPVDNNEFDVITSNCVINHIKDKEKVYKEIYRVLKPSGYFLVADVMSIDQIPEHIADDPKYIAMCFAGAINKEKYLEIITKIGFKNIKILYNRIYEKHSFLLESIIIKGEKL